VVCIPIKWPYVSLSLNGSFEKAPVVTCASVFFFSSSEIVHRAPGWTATKITRPTLSIIARRCREKLTKIFDPLSQLPHPSIVVYSRVIYHDFGDNNYLTRHRYYHMAKTEQTLRDFNLIFFFVLLSYEKYQRILRINKNPNK
jgi:hypothetical protein